MHEDHVSLISAQAASGVIAILASARLETSAQAFARREQIATAAPVSASYRQDGRHKYRPLWEPDLRGFPPPEDRPTSFSPWSDSLDDIADRLANKGGVDGVPDDPSPCVGTPVNDSLGASGNVAVILAQAGYRTG